MAGAERASELTRKTGKNDHAPMKLRVGVLVAALGATQLAGCSIMDPSDRQALRDKINGMAPMILRDLKREISAMSAHNWLKQQPENDEIGNVLCRVKAGESWDEWQDQHKPMTVEKMIDCLM